MKKGATSDKFRLLETTVNTCKMDKISNNSIARAFSESLKLIGFTQGCSLKKGHYERINWTFRDEHIPPAIISFFSSTGRIRIYFTIFGKAKVASVKRSMINYFKIEITGTMAQNG